MASMGTIQMDNFVYIPASAEADWNRFMLKFNLYIQAQSLDITKTEQAVKALAHLLLLGGEKAFDIYSMASENGTITYQNFLKEVDKGH